MIKYKQPYFAVKIYYEKKYWLQGLIKFYNKIYQTGNGNRF
jgi:hypothetical protein